MAMKKREPMVWKEPAMPGRTVPSRTVPRCTMPSTAVPSTARLRLSSNQCSADYRRRCETSQFSLDRQFSHDHGVVPAVRKHRP
jgi:hypothetical protein